GPLEVAPISVQWGEQAQMRFHDKQCVFFGDEEVPFLEVDLTLGGVTADGAIDIQIACERATTVYRLTINPDLPGGYRHEHVSGPEAKHRKSNDAPVPFEEYLEKDPFIVRYADGTYSYNCYHIPVKLDAGLF